MVPRQKRWPRSHLSNRGKSMSDKSPGEQELAPETRPKLAARARMQTDKVTGQPVLLYPEGVVALNETGAAIIALCDGERTLKEIVAELAARYHAAPEQLHSEVRAYLLGLHRHSLLALLPET